MVEVEPNQHFATRKLGHPERDLGGSDGFGSRWKPQRYIFGHIWPLNTRSRRLCGFRSPCAIWISKIPLFFKKYSFYCSTSTAGSYQSRDPISKLSTVPESSWSDVLCEIIFFWKKTVITLNQKLTYQHFSNSNYQKTVREMRSRTRKPRSRVGGGTSPSHTKKRRLKVISFGKRRFKHPRLS